MVAAAWARIVMAAAVSLTAAGCADGLAGPQPTASCDEVTKSFQGQAELKSSAEARAADLSVAVDVRMNARDDGLVAQISALQIIVDNAVCFKAEDVSQAKGLLPVVQQQLVDLRRG